MKNRRSKTTKSGVNIDTKITKVTNFALNSSICATPAPLQYLATEHTVVTGDHILSFLHDNLPSLKYYEATNTLTLTDKDMCYMVENITDYMHRFEEAYNLSEFEGAHSHLDFLKSKRLMIQPTGVAKLVNKYGNLVEIYGSTGHAYRITMMSRVTSISGSSLVSLYPMILVSVPTVGGLFFMSLSRITTSIPIMSQTSEALGNVCLLPLKGTEVVLNNLLIRPISEKLLGTPVMVNFTSTLSNGPGFVMEKYPDFLNYLKVNKQKVGTKLIQGIQKLFGSTPS